MALRNLPDGKRLGDSLRALEEIQRRADSLIADVQTNGSSPSHDPESPLEEETNGEHTETEKPLLQVAMHVSARTSEKPAADPKNGDATTQGTAKTRDPFLDSLEALRRTLRHGQTKSAQSTETTSVPADTVHRPETKLPQAESKPEPPASIEPSNTAVADTPASGDTGKSISALENMPLPEVERAPTPLPQADEQRPAMRRRTPTPVDRDETEKSLDNALDAVRASVGLPKVENGRPRTPSTPRPRKKRPLSDGIPKSVSEDLPKFRGQPRMRICNRCGHETRLRDPECRNCGKVDESLGILDAVISGDLIKVEQILLVRPHLISVQTNRHAWTLLHMAASGGNKKMTELLIAKGAAVNATNRDGKTPLHYAAGKGHLNVVETLLAHFADVEAEYNGKTAADLAHEHNQFEVETYLRNLPRPTAER